MLLHGDRVAHYLRSALTLSGASGGKDVPQPLRWARPVEQHGVDSTRRQRRKFAQIKPNSALNARLLLRADTRGCATKSLTVSLSHFNKYECFAFAHDEINFTETTQPVALDQRQPACFK